MRQNKRNEQHRLKMKEKNHFKINHLIKNHQAKNIHKIILKIALIREKIRIFNKIDPMDPKKIIEIFQRKNLLKNHTLFQMHVPFRKDKV